MTTQTESQIKSDLHDLFEKASKIEAKYPNGVITSPDDVTEIEGIMGVIREKELSLQEVEMAGERHRLIMEGQRRYGTPSGGGVPPIPTSNNAQPNFRGKSIGQIFAESDVYDGARKEGLFDSTTPAVLRLSVPGFSLLDAYGFGQKTLVHGTASGLEIAEGGPFESRDRRPGYLPLLYHPLSFLDTLMRVPTDEELIQWVKELTFTNNAAEVAEATATTGTSGTKPESAFTFEVDETTVKDIAHWIPVTNKMLRNKAMIGSIIDQRLRLGLDLRLGGQVVNGDGTDATLLGILATTGVQVQGQNSDVAVDAIHKAITKVRVVGYSEPTHVFMNAYDWEIIRLSKDGNDNYIFGPPSQPGLPVVWGKPIVPCQQLTQGTALVADMGQCTLYDRMRTVVRTGTINDQMIRNMQTLLAELAVAFAVWRPAGFCKVTGISA